MVHATMDQKQAWIRSKQRTCTRTRKCTCIMCAHACTRAHVHACTWAPAAWAPASCAHDVVLAPHPEERSNVLQVRESEAVRSPADKPADPLPPPRLPGSVVNVVSEPANSHEPGTPAAEQRKNNALPISLARLATAVAVRPTLSSERGHQGGQTRRRRGQRRPGPRPTPMHWPTLRQAQRPAGRVTFGCTNQDGVLQKHVRGRCCHHRPSVFLFWDLVAALGARCVR